jgi:two-component system chemotaxis sensor kinase CheA
MTNDTDFELDEMQEIIADFLVEADELVGSLDADLVTLESAPEDLELLNGIFRAAHTIKGTSSFLGFDQVTGLTHKMEDVLNKLRKAELVVCPEIMDVLLESVDILKVLLDHVRDKTGEEIDLTAILKRLVDVDEGRVGGAGSDSDATLNAEPDAEVDSDDVEPTAEADDHDDLTAEAVVPETTGEESAAPAQTAVATRKSTKPAKGGEHSTIRVEVSRLDSLMNLMGELVLSRNGLLKTISTTDLGDEHTELTEDLNRASASVNYITTELQVAVMKMRMQPVSKVFAKFPRLVRDLARESKKEIELQLTGESTELDKSVIEEIGDPLVHIIRNSCDHGIESPEERVANGKPAKGTVKITASQEGSNIILKIEDDGKGLDVDGIRLKVVERGLLSEADANRLPDRELYKYIFAAGFSTAKVVTDVSGRGVGMDVVRTNIEKLNGLVELDSVRGRGMTITIRLPLTLAIIQGLLIESDDDVFILPLSSVHETVRTDHANIYYINQKPVMRLRDEIIPLINLNQILSKDPAGFIMSEKPYVVVIGLAHRKLGVLIDRFLGQEEVVIKSLGRYLGATAGVAGATILGDGRIRLIVDLLGLFEIATKLN